MGAAPAGVPGGTPGLAANALAQVREAMKLLEGALPNLPQGTKPYTEVLSTLQKFGKLIPPSNEIPGIQNSALRGIVQNAQQQAPMQALMRSLGGAGQGGPSGAGAPAPGGPAQGLPGGAPGAPSLASVVRPPPGASQFTA
jgi:hypothetical protein